MMMHAIAVSLLLAAEISVPVCEVVERADPKASVYPGRIVPIAQVDVIPQVSGEIREVCFANGQVVKEGDVLYRIDPIKYEAAVKNAESKLQECKANVQYAELSYERHKKLLETRAVSLDAVDNALSQRDSSRAALAAAQAELIAARDDLNHCKIVAPIAGKVGSTAKTKGNYVAAGSLTLVTIVQMDPIRVRFSVSNRELLDIVDQDYVLDRLGGIASPRGMSGRVLSLNTLQIHADRNRIQDARTASEAAHLEIRDPLYAVTCAADAVLEDHERKNGVLVLDLGGGSTGYAVYADGYAVSTGVFGVGGDHVTSDIAQAFQTTNAQAEGLKKEEASARISSAEGDSARVRVERGENTLMDNRTISRRALDTVVNARLLELFTMIRETLEEQDLLHRLHAGVVLTGGGAQMRDVEALAEQVLGTSVRLGRPIHVDGLDDAPFPPAFAAVAGALLYAHRNYEEKSILDGLLGRFFK